MCLSIMKNFLPNTVSKKYPSDRILRKFNFLTQKKINGPNRAYSLISLEQFKLINNYNKDPQLNLIKKYEKYKFIFF